MYPFTFEGTTIYCKTIATLKRERQLRRRALYNAEHLHDRIQLISAMVAVSAVFISSTIIA